MVREIPDKKGWRAEPKAGLERAPELALAALVAKAAKAAPVAVVAEVRASPLPTSGIRPRSRATIRSTPQRRLPRAVTAETAASGTRADRGRKVPRQRGLHSERQLNSADS